MQSSSDFWATFTSPLRRMLASNGAEGLEIVDQSPHPANYNSLDQMDGGINEGGNDERDDDGTIYSPARASSNSWLPLSLQVPFIAPSSPFSTFQSNLQRSFFSTLNSMTIDSSGANTPTAFSSNDINQNRREFSSSSRTAEMNSSRSSHSHTTSRLVDRDGDFHQSRGRVAIRKKIKRNDWRALYAYDLFHSLVDAPTSRTILILLTIYICWIIIFSVIYYILSSVAPQCNLGLQNYQEAFFFSLETMATIGYGTRDIFFGDCLLPAIVLTIHMCVRLVSDAITVGVIYSRLARPTTRASTVLFTTNAIIRRIRGRLYFMFQLCELRKHQLNEAHVRVYAVKQERDPGHALREEKNGVADHIHLSALSASIPSTSTPSTSTPSTYALPPALITPRSKRSTYPIPPTSSISQPPDVVQHDMSNFQTCSMRLNHPNDELGGMLLLCLPQLVVHEIDAMSPLMPPPLWVSREPHSPLGCSSDSVDESETAVHTCIHRWSPPVYGNTPTLSTANNATASTLMNDTLASLSFPASSKRGVDLREWAFRDPSSRDAVNAGTGTAGIDAVYYSEGLAEYMYHNSGTLAATSSMAEFTAEQKRTETPRQKQERLMIQSYLSDRKCEIVAIVEGMDAATGGVVQARHSYTFDEIKWHHGYSTCLSEDKEESGFAIIDFAKFHSLVPVSVDATFAGVVSSQV